MCSSSSVVSPNVNNRKTTKTFFFFSHAETSRHQRRATSTSISPTSFFLVNSCAITSDATTFIPTKQCASSFFFCQAREIMYLIIGWTIVTSLWRGDCDATIGSIHSGLGDLSCYGFFCLSLSPTLFFFCLWSCLF